MTYRVIESAVDRIQSALDIAWRYGQIDGDHHKTWVIDQMVRVLHGDPEEYKHWVNEYEMPDYKWNEGIAP